MEKAERISLCFWLNRIVENAIGDAAKKYEWPSELYSLFSLGIGISLFLSASLFSAQTPNWSRWLLLVFALYFSLEIFIFALNWVFVHRGPILSYKRSLAGFGLNFITVVFCFAAAYLWGKCMGEESEGLTAFYSSLRIAVTIGPVDAQDDINNWHCRSLIIGEIAVAYFLAITVIANLVGAVRRRESAGPDASAE